MNRVSYSKKIHTERFFFQNQIAFGGLFIIFFIFGFLAFGCKAKKENDKKTAEPNEEREIEQYSPIKVESMVDNSEVMVGDVITYTLRVDAIPEITPKIPEMGSKIFSLRIIDMGAEGPKEEAGRKTWEKWYKLQADITGSYIIPPAQVLYEDPNGNQMEVTAPQIFIEVKSVIKEGEELGDIRDIKPLRSIKNDLKLLYIVVTISVVLIILIILGVWLYFRKKRKEIIANQPSPDEVAMNELENLKASEYLDQQDYRSFYFRLSEIFRAYMEKRFGFPAQESTTEELIPQIEQLALTRAQKDTVRFLARGEDLVKFARHYPSSEKAQQDWEETRSFILATTEKPETDEG
jgi:hypothetical protein